MEGNWSLSRPLNDECTIICYREKFHRFMTVNVMAVIISAPVRYAQYLTL